MSVYYFNSKTHLPTSDLEIEIGLILQTLPGGVGVCYLNTGSILWITSSSLWEKWMGNSLQELSVYPLWPFKYGWQDYISFALFSKRQTLGELLMQRYYCLQRKIKSFVVYIDTQCRFMECPIVRQWLWESRAELLLVFVIRGRETSDSEEPVVQAVRERQTEMWVSWA